MTNRAIRRAVESKNRRALRAGDGWGEWQKAGAEELESLQARHPIASLCTAAWRNRRFVVLLYPVETEWGTVLHLHLRPVDQGKAPRWAELQRVKNELIGEERVAVEVFPRASELVDQADAYHLWVLPTGFDLPFGLHRPGGGYAPR